jgi:TrpR-related protein YerC/YecD
MPKHKHTSCHELFQALLTMRTSEEMSRFCRDLLSKHEIEELSRRWQVACMLAHKVSYTEIEQQTGLSSATIAKISHWLKRGLGGYKLAIKRLKSRS